MKRKLNQCRKALFIFSPMAFVFLGTPVWGTFRLSMDTVSGPPSTQVIVSVRGYDFTSILSMQGTIKFNTTVAAFNQTTNVNLSGVTFGTNQSGAGLITFSWFDPSPTLNGQTLSDGTILFAIRFDIVGNPGEETAIIFFNTPTSLEFTKENNPDPQISDPLDITQTTILQNGLIHVSCTPTDCNDSDSCTNDTCLGGECVYTPLDCDDNDACTSDECNSGVCSHTLLACDDSDTCTIDVCDVIAGCQYSPNPNCANPCMGVDCDDNDACTADSCSSGSCSNTAIVCDDSDLCTADACVSGQCVFTPIDCDDNDACTNDTCSNGSCSNAAIVCDDSDLCTTDACAGGQCVFTSLNCDDNDACTSDACLVGSCVNTTASCDDADACTNDFCDSVSGCFYVAVNCDDASACTDDFCDSLSGCLYAPLSCDDGDVCTDDICDPLSGCFHLPVDCNDGDACTTDFCDSSGCFYVTVNCDDASACTLDSCSSLTGCFYQPADCDDGDTCTIDLCDALAGCRHTLNPNCTDPCPGVNCDDSDACTADTCINGQCSNTPLDCDDADACTDDSCSSGVCVNTPVICNDNDLCTTDACSGGQCVYAPLDCDDNDICTADSCTSGQCTYISIPGCNNPCDTLVCDDNDLCTTDSCANGGCRYSPISCDDNDSCTADNCINGVCQNATIICDDGNPCTHDECVNGNCTFTSVVCDDSDLCTADACIGGQCSYTPIDCSDNDACTTDNCNSGTGACFNAPLNCDDEEDCTDDSCDNGTCVNSPAVCDDNDLCTTDTCLNGCIFTSIACDDGDACSTDECVSGVCIFNPIICDDGNPCTNDACLTWQCVFTPVICDDSDDCTNDDCVNGTCVYTPVICDDLDICTADSCLSGLCSFAPIPNCVDPCDTLVCDDNDLCTADACANGNCQNASIDCDDNDLCTADACSNGVCENNPLNCDDGNACTNDACVNGSCVSIAIICDDFDVCTTDSCVNAQCVFTPIPNCANPCDTLVCDDNNLCTTDTCANGACMSTPLDCDDNDVCTVDFCVNGQCFHTATIITPSVNIVVDNTNVCAGSSVTFTATPNGEGTSPLYQWQVNGVSTGPDAPVFTTTSLNDGDSVWVQLTSSAPCASPATVNSNIIAISVGSSQTVSFTGLVAEYCADTTAQHLAGTPPGGVFTGAGISGDTFVPYFAGPGPHLISYSYSFPGCTGVSTQAVIVHANPEVDILNLDNTYCYIQGTDTLTGIPAGGAFSGMGMNGNIFTVPALSSATTILISYAFTDSNTCRSEITKETTVYPFIEPRLSGFNNNYCEDASQVVLTGIPAGGAFSGTGVAGNVFYPRTAGVGSHTVEYTVIDSNNCPSKTSEVITVRQLPSASIVGLDTAYCINASDVTLAGTPPGGNFTGEAVNNGVFSPNHASPDTTYDLIYSYTDVYGCTGTDTQTVRLLNAPFVSLTSPKSVFCAYEGAVALTVNISGGTFSGTGVTGNLFNPAQAGSGIHLISYSLTNPDGCLGVDTLILKVDECSGIAPVDDGSVRIYPNPGDGILTIETLTQNNSAAHLRLYSIEGKLLLEKEISGTKCHLNLTEFSSGMYCLKINAGDKLLVKRVVIGR